MKRYQQLAGHPIACILRESICSHRALTLNDLSNILQEKEFNLSKHENFELVRFINFYKPSDKEQVFLKLRVNYYQRVTHGLWSCINDKCNQKPEALKNWGFGQVYATHQEKCACGAPVLELTFCKEL